MDFSFTAPLDKHDSSLGWFYIVFIPADLIPKLGKEKSPRVKATFNDSEVAHISVKSRGEERYLVVNSELRKKLKLEKGMPVHLRLEEEKSEYGMPMPEELALMLAEDEMANHHFHQLTPGVQRSLIYLVLKIKSVDARIRKALAIVEHLNEYDGKLDFKALMAKMIEVNQRYKMRS